MRNRRNYYRILHVQPDAPGEIIKASYRTLMQKLKLHPDLGGDEWNATILNEAYATLSNKELRAAYDQRVLHRVKKTPSTRASQAQAKPAKPASRKAGPSPSFWKDPSLCPFCGTAIPARSEYNTHTFDCSRCRSPLTRVVQMEITGQSKRKLERRLLDAAVRVYTSPGTAAATPGVVMNLSPQGMQLIAAVKPEIGQVLKLVSVALSATARVCHCSPANKPGHYAIGVKFLTLQFHDPVGTFFHGSA